MKSQVFCDKMMVVMDFVKVIPASVIGSNAERIRAVLSKMGDIELVGEKLNRKYGLKSKPER